MKKTENFALSQWEAHDPIRREDFNADNAAIDAALKNLNTTLTGYARVECGTYKGTSTYGADNPSTLTFGIEPKVVFIFTTDLYGPMANTAYTGSAMGVTNVVFYYGGSKIRTYSSGDEGTMYYTLLGNTLTWYSTQSKGVQMNHNSETYGYIAIG